MTLIPCSLPEDSQSIFLSIHIPQSVNLMQSTESCSGSGGDGPGDGDGFGNGDFGGGTLSVAFRQVLLSVIITIIRGKQQPLS